MKKEVEPTKMLAVLVTLLVYSESGEEKSRCLIMKDRRMTHL